MNMTMEEMLDKLAKGEIKKEDVIAQVNAEKANKDTGLFCKFAENSKWLSVYGLQTRPVTVYAQGWVRLLESSDMIINAIKENIDRLDWKNPADKKAFQEKYCK